MRSNLSNKILVEREVRWRRICDHFISSKNYIVTLSLNIPGKIKRKKSYLKFYRIVNNCLSDFLHDKYKIILEEELINEAGYFNIIIINKENNYEKIKKNLIKIENLFEDCSKFIDIDLYVSHDRTISREDLGLKPRQCFLCDDQALICSREKRHNAKHILKYVNKKIKNFITKYKKGFYE